MIKNQFYLCMRIVEKSISMEILTKKKSSISSILSPAEKLQNLKKEKISLNLLELKEELKF